MEPQVEVWHFLLAREARADESWRTTSLSQPASYAMRGVGYVLQIAADVEFPTEVKPPGAVYLRVHGDNCGPQCVLFKVCHRDVRGVWRILASIRAKTSRPIPLPESAEEVHDIVIQLPYLRLGGLGLHAISVSFCNHDSIPEPQASRLPYLIPAWQSDPEEMFGADGWRFGSVEYFWVERES